MTDLEEKRKEYTTLERNGEIFEEERTIVLTDGEEITVLNVIKIIFGGRTLRIQTKEGFYYIIKGEFIKYMVVKLVGDIIL